MPLSNIANLDPVFLKVCLNVPKQTEKASIPSPLPQTSTVVSPAATKVGKPDLRSARSRLTSNYPDAFTDFYGTPTGAPCIYKTGPAWPNKRRSGPQAQPYIREMRPVHGHPITPTWREFLKDAQAYLDADLGVKFTAIMGSGFANAGEKTPFCPLLVTIGVPPNSLAFEAAKKAADHVKGTILSQAGFSNIDVAVRELTTTLSGRGPELQSLNPLIDAVAEFRHPFTSTLGLSIAPSKTPCYEGTVALYLRRGNDNDDVLAITAAHVARPPPVHPNTGISPPNSTEHREEIMVLGNKAYEVAITDIMSRIGTLHEINTSLEENILTLGRLQAEGREDAKMVASALLRAQRDAGKTKRDIERLDQMHSDATKRMTNPIQRPIGFVLHADPIGAADGPNGFTLDWAAIQLSKDAFDWANFKGNEVYVGGKVMEEEYGDLMFPNHLDRAGYMYPQDGLLQVFGVVPESEIRQPEQLNVHGDKAMPVIKNGSTTGTTVGWVNGLESLVRYYSDYDLEFTAFETTILPYHGRGGFSDKGDSGAIVLDRGGRIVAMLTGGCGTTDETDVSFGTAWYDLEPHIKRTLPGCFRYPVVPEN